MISADVATKTLRLHGFLQSSLANGPGKRAVIWVRGCSLACPGCFNPDSHSVDGGKLISTSELAREVLELTDEIEGVTISGGEPLQQADAILTFAETIKRQSNLTVLLFSGFSWDEISRMPVAERLSTCVDLLIAGRYIESERLGKGLIGSTNKTVHFLSDRYSMKDLESVPSCEVLISANGDISVSGIDPLAL